MLKIHHPRKLISLLLVIGSIGATAAVIVNQQDSDGTSTPSTIPISSPLDEADKQAAVDVLRQSGVVERIAGDQPWTASDFNRRPVGNTMGVYFIASWEQPVEYSGTLRDGDECQGTRAYDYSETWTGIRRLDIIVEVDHSEVVHYMPYSRTRVAPGTTPLPNSVLVDGVDPEDQVTVYDQERRRVIYEGSLKDAPESGDCPPGKEND